MIINGEFNEFNEGYATQYNCLRITRIVASEFE